MKLTNTNELRKVLSDSKFDRLYPKIVKLMDNNYITTIQALKDVGISMSVFKRNLSKSQQREIYELNHYNVKKRGNMNTVNKFSKKVKGLSKRKKININEELSLLVSKKGMDPDSLAKNIKVSYTTAIHLLNGSQSITLYTAMKLEKAKLKTARYWLVKQLNQELDKLGL